MGIREYPKKEKELKKINDKLTIELSRKEKAIAEVTALLGLRNYGTGCIEFYILGQAITKEILVFLTNCRKIS